MWCVCRPTAPAPAQTTRSKPSIFIRWASGCLWVPGGWVDARGLLPWTGEQLRLFRQCWKEPEHGQPSLDPPSPPPPRPSSAAPCLQGKDTEILRQLLGAQACGQPVLVGAGSVQESEALVARLAPQLRCVGRAAADGALRCAVRLLCAVLCTVLCWKCLVLPAAGPPAI